jgi:hypothetical protein
LKPQDDEWIYDDEPDEYCVDFRKCAHKPIFIAPNAN